jgi:hypothetical protein
MEDIVKNGKSEKKLTMMAMTVIMKKAAMTDLLLTPHGNCGIPVS